MNAEYYKLLNEFVAFRTVANSDESKQEFKKCVSWIEQLLKSKWFTVNLITQYGNPIVVADAFVDSELETWVIYWNYDVVPADKKDWRKEDPFSLYLWKEKIIWRWICNGKWELLMYILWIEELIKSNKLKFNVRFIIEWDRYNWSFWLKQLLEKSELKADFFVSSIWVSLPNYSVVNTWFRWWFTSKLVLKSANTEFDTARFSSIIPNVLNESISLFSKLYDINWNITIPYFYYDVEKISANEKTMNWRIKYDMDSLQEKLWLKKIRNNDSDIFSTSWFVPMVEITWISSGNTAEERWVIPNVAVVTLDFKLVSNQKVDSVQSLFQQWIKSNLPDYIDCQLSFSWGAEPVRYSTDNYFADRAKDILLKSHGNRVVNFSSWFTFPVAKSVYNNVTKNIVNVPLINDDCNLWILNENIDINLIENWINFVSLYFWK